MGKMKQNRRALIRFTKSLSIRELVNYRLEQNSMNLTFLFPVDMKITAPSAKLIVRQFSRDTKRVNCYHGY